MNHTELLHAELVRARQHDLMAEADRWRNLTIAAQHAGLIHTKHESNVSRLGFPAALIMLGVLLTVLIVAVPASAHEIDLGNDGVDWDCESFPEKNAADGYFAHDGGSADRNIDNLDPDGDGVPCNELPQDPGDDVPRSGNDNAENGSGAVTALPDTGTGRANADSDPVGPMALVVVVATIGGAVACERRRRSIG